jgi:spore coat polysaccharide biosynthesis protein SpsF
MEGGQLNNIKIGYIIQARMKSTRLPGKILLPLPFKGGKPLLKWITDSLKKSTFNHKIIIASSINEENDILQDFCNKEHIDLYRGDEENVLSRFIEITKIYNFDVIVRLTADNPILDLTILESVILEHINSQKDYTKTEGLPIGMNFEIINPNELLKTVENKLSKDDYEHVTLYTKTNSDNKLVVNYNSFNTDKLRLTIDYPSDFAAISLLLTCQNLNETINFEWIKKVYTENKWIFEINESNIQKKQYSSEKDEIENAIEILKKYDLNFAANKLSNLD